MKRQWCFPIVFYFFHCHVLAIEMNAPLFLTSHSVRSRYNNVVPNQTSLDYGIATCLNENVPAGAL